MLNTIAKEIFNISSFTCDCIHHTITPFWIYRIPSELRSQAEMGLPSTVVGDHTGIVSVVCFCQRLVCRTVFNKCTWGVLSQFLKLLRRVF